MVTIRTIRESDAGEFLSLCNRLDGETSFRLLEPGERSASVESQRETIARILAEDKDVILVAEVGGQLVGYIAGIAGKHRRNRHAVEVIVSVLQAFSGQGIATRLFERLQEWARERRIRRLELTVMVHNARAIALYQRLGFEIEGRKRDALLVDGDYVDEYLMAKLLEQVSRATAETVP